MQRGDPYLNKIQHTKKNFLDQNIKKKFFCVLSSFFVCWLPTPVQTFHLGLPRFVYQNFGRRFCELSSAEFHNGAFAFFFLRRRIIRNKLTLSTHPPPLFQALSQEQGGVILNFNRFKSQIDVLYVSRPFYKRHTCGL